MLIIHVLTRLVANENANANVVDERGSNPLVKSSTFGFHFCLGPSTHTDISDGVIYLCLFLLLLFSP